MEVKSNYNIQADKCKLEFINKQEYPSMHTKETYYFVF